MRQVDIEGFENYQITDDGRVWSKKREIYLKISDNGNGYKIVVVRKDGIKYHLYIHRLVAIAFVENPELKPIVGHRDCDTSNNNYTNLYWCTQDENNKHPITRQRRSQSLKGRIRNDLIRDELGRYTKKGYKI
jgi:hypothetical protein